METQYPNLDIQLLGVNSFGQEAGVPTATANRDIPMLQDVDTNGDHVGDVWTLWNAEWRDLVILDANNNRAGLINLTLHDLADPANYDTVKSMLLDAAQSIEPVGSVSGFAYFDVNNDGIKSASESPISNVEIVLAGTDSQGQAVARTVVTGADGSYSFQTIKPGTYTVTQTQPAFTLDGKDSVGSAGGTADNNKFSITLGSGQQGTDYNFGELGRQPESISALDFLASTPRNAILVAAESSTGKNWYTLEGDWSSFRTADVAAAAASPVTVTVRDTSGHKLEGSYARNDHDHVHVLAESNGMQLMRVSGALADITPGGNSGAAGSTAATTNPDAASEGESSPMTLVDAEGEALTPALQLATTSLVTSAQVPPVADFADPSSAVTFVFPADPSQSAFQPEDNRRLTSIVDTENTALTSIDNVPATSNIDAALEDERLLEPLGPQF